MFSFCFINSIILPTELSLRNYSQGEHIDPVTLLSLRQLVSLDLYRTSFPTATLVALVQQNPQLKHLNLGILL